MGLIDLILNFTGLLFWLNWRSGRFDPLVRTSVSSLAGTLRPAEKRKFRGWPSLAGLAGLLVVRAFLYWQLGSPAMWNPKLHLYFVLLAFRCDDFLSALVFSLLSFLRVFIVFYFWLVALCLADHGFSDTDPVQRLLRLHLGRLARWNRFVQLAIIPLAALMLWVALNPLLARVGVLSPARSVAIILEQGVLVSLGLILSLKYLFPAFLFLHFISSYVFLGNNPVWEFVSRTARSLLSPLRRLPLQIGRLDLAPLVGLVLLLVLLEILPRAILAWLTARKLACWPQ
jgi:uncharacterized protein YggT (Ycf19 family)